MLGGNVRELQHAIERAVILSESNWLRPEDFYSAFYVPLRDKEPSDELNLTRYWRKKRSNVPVVPREYHSLPPASRDYPLYLVS